MMTIADVEDVAVKNKVMKKRQYRSRQGRSDEQYVDNLKVLAYAGLALFSLMLGFAVVELVYEFIYWLDV
jgi:hypothetical protein